MIAENSLYSLLSAATGVTALVADRLYPDAMPEGCAYPAVVFSRTGTEPIPSISGQNFGGTVTLSIGCWAKTRTDVDAVALAISTAVAGTAFSQTGRDAGFDNETGLFATILTLEILETP